MNKEEGFQVKEKIELSGGVHNGGEAFTNPANNEVGLWGKKHRWCEDKEVYVYRRRGETKFFDFFGMDGKEEDCFFCEEDRKRWEAETEEQRYKRTIEVTCEIGEWGYDWSVAQLGKSPDGRIWFRYGAGCSCNDITDEEWQELREVENAKMACRHIGSAADRARYIATAQTMIGERV
jgi:hypothetical protein